MEHLLAKEGVAGSIPVSRLKKERYRMVSFFFSSVGLGSKVRCLRSAPVRAVRGPPDLVRRLALFQALILGVMGTNSYYSGVVPSLAKIMGTERYIPLHGTHIKTRRGYRKISFLTLCPDSDKPWVQSDIFYCSIPSLG